MRIRWTTRIAVAIGMITLIAGVAVGGGSASAATTRPASATAGYVTAGR